MRCSGEPSVEEGRRDDAREVEDSCIFAGTSCKTSTNERAGDEHIRTDDTGMKMQASRTLADDEKNIQR
jgi:hypothetical protein